MSGPPTWQGSLKGSALTAEERAAAYAQLEDDAGLQAQLAAFAALEDTTPSTLAAYLRRKCGLVAAATAAGKKHAAMQAAVRGP